MKNVHGSSPTMNDERRTMNYAGSHSSFIVPRFALVPQRRHRHHVLPVAAQFFEAFGEGVAYNRRHHRTDIAAQRGNLAHGGELKKVCSSRVTSATTSTSGVRRRF